MNITVRKNGGFSSALSDFFAPASLLDFDGDFLPARLGISVPTANVSETNKEYIVELAAPGLERNDFDVQVDNHTLTISAEKEEEKNQKDGDYSRREYSFNSFTRSFTLPEDIKEGAIDAKYEKGILKVSIPKLKETPVKPAKKISVS